MYMPEINQLTQKRIWLQSLTNIHAYSSRATSKIIVIVGGNFGNSVHGWPSYSKTKGKAFSLLNCRY